MRVAPATIFLFRDVDGLGPALADALRTNPRSNLTRESSSFELSLEKYGVKDSKAAGDLIQFIDPTGSPQPLSQSNLPPLFLESFLKRLRSIPTPYFPEVSIFLLPNYGPPLAACVIDDLLSSLSIQSTVILPFVMKTLKVNREAMDELPANQEVMFCAAEIGRTSEITKSMISGTTKLPPSFQIHCEPLSCLLLMARLRNLPTVLLIASSCQHRNGRASNSEIKALCKLGKLVANHLGICFSYETIQQEHIEKAANTVEPWREFYG